MSASALKVLYFTAGSVATAAELAEIARLETVFRSVLVRNGGDSAANLRFSGGLESFDKLAGTAIPTAYSTDHEADVIAIPAGHNPDQFKVFPATLALDLSDVDKMQLAAIKAVVDPATGLASMTDLAADDSVTWSTSNGAHATVGADGLVTAAGVGTPTITARLQAVASITGIAAEADDDLFTKSAHGLVTGDAVDLLDLGSGTGFGSVGDTRYVIKVSASTFKLATSYANAVAGTAIDVTGDATNASLCKARVSSTCAVTVTA